MAKPIGPMGDNYPSFGDYGDIKIDRSNSLAEEPLVDIGNYGIAGDSYYARTDGQNEPYNAPITGATKQIYLRESIATKLLAVNEKLAEHGYEVHVFDGYRPISCQQGIWDHFWEKYKSEHTNTAGDVDEEALRNHVLANVSDPNRFDPNDSSTWPVHSTGGAVDLTLKRLDNGELVDMGAHFDEMEKSDSAYLERLLQTGEIFENDPALLARRLLVEVMEDEGFRNHGSEWFHYGWGDQMSAKLNGEQTAFYGYVAPPPGCELVTKSERDKMIGYKSDDLEHDGLEHG